MPRKAKIEPDYLEIGGVTVANLDICPQCDGEGEVDYFTTEPRKVPVLVTAACPACGGCGLAFPSEAAAYIASLPRHARAA